MQHRSQGAFPWLWRTLEMGRPTSKVNEERPGDEVGNNGKAAKLPKVKLDFARCSFYFLGGSLFNSLPLSLRKKKKKKSLRNTNFKVLFRKALHDFTCNFYCSFKRFFLTYCMFAFHTPISIKVASVKNDTWSMFPNPRCIMGASSVKYVPATSLETRRNLESKHY